MNIHPEFLASALDKELPYLGKFISYRHKDPTLNSVYGVQTGAVIGVLVMMPGFSEGVEMLIGRPGEEPDFIFTEDVEIVRLASTLPEETATS